MLAAETAELARQRICAELQQQCARREGAAEAGALRVGALLCFLGNVEELAHRLREDFTLGSFADASYKQAWEEYRRIMWGTEPS